MNRVIVVTDSNSGITQSEAKELGVVVMPMPFYINGQMFYEDIDLTQEQFYQKLKEGGEIKTSMPLVGDVTDKWDELLKEYDEIVYIPMSSGLSSSCETAYMLSQDYDGKVQVKADEYKIYQVIYNLINNAINYTGKDKTVWVRQKISGDKVRIEVTDSGDGIAKEALPYVWDRYYKVDKTHKRAVMGTGLGLSIVKNILELHHAGYGVVSEPGCGSTFWFELKIER